MDASDLTVQECSLDTRGQQSVCMNLKTLSIQFSNKTCVMRFPATDNWIDVFSGHSWSLNESQIQYVCLLVAVGTRVDFACEFSAD